MKKGGERQDVTHMKIALVVLLGAVAVFLAARLLTPKPVAKPAPRTEAARKTDKPNPPPRAAAAQAKAGGAEVPAVPAATATPGKRPGRDPSAYTASAAHDPFKGSYKGTGPRNARSSALSAARTSGTSGASPGGPTRTGEPEVDLQLVGITHGRTAMAVIRDTEDETHYLQVGQKVGEYTVVKIGAGTVEVANGTTKTVLRLSSGRHHRRSGGRDSYARPRPVRRTYGNRP